MSGALFVQLAGVGVGSERIWRRGDRVEVLQFDAGVGGGEAPVHGGVGAVARFLPGGDLLLERDVIGDAPVQALPAEHAEFDFRHVQPTAVFGRMVQFQPIQDVPGFFGREGLVQGTGRVRVEVVADQTDLGCGGKVLIHQVVHGVGPVQAGAVLRHRNMAPARQRGEAHEQVRHAVAHVLVVLVGRVARAAADASRRPTACWPRPYTPAAGPDPPVADRGRAPPPSGPRTPRSPGAGCTSSPSAKAATRCL